MNRDGALPSLWQQGIPNYSTEAPKLPDKVFDVVIVGGGITGVTTGLLLQKSGLSCLIAEAYNLCFGTTGGTTSHLNTFLDTDYHTVIDDFGEENAQLLHQATRQALDLVKRHIQEYNIDCGYEEKDGYVYAQNDDQVNYLDKIFAASQKAGAEVESTDRIPVSIPFQKAIVYHRQAQIHPSRYVYALAKAFEAAGGVIAERCRITNVDDSEPLYITSSLGHIKAHQLIYATHLPPGINLLHFRCAPYRSYAMAVTLKDGAYPDGLAYDMYDPYHYYRTQDVDGKKYLIAGGEDHKTGHNKNTEQCFRDLESHIRKFYDVDQVAFKWSSQYFEPSDGLAYIGHLPGYKERLFVATGYSGNGITYSHIAAISLSDMITKGDSEYAKLFNPNRIKPVAGFMDFVKENADVVGQFVSKRIQQEKLESLADLAVGEAKVVKFEGESVALYKDESGQLFAVNPVCKHAKCIVDWNNAEKSWDCPCHGARYDVQGHVITGPARTDLEIIELENIIIRGEGNQS